MSASKFFNAINQRYFFTVSYRLILKALIILNMCNLIFVGAVSFIFYKRGQHVYYATSGDSSPIPLTALHAPNNTATPLLADDIPSDTGPNINLLN